MHNSLYLRNNIQLSSIEQLRIGAGIRLREHVKSN